MGSKMQMMLVTWLQGLTKMHLNPCSLNQSKALKPGFYYTSGPFLATFISSRWWLRDCLEYRLSPLAVSYISIGRSENRINYFKLDGGFYMSLQLW